MRFFTWRLEDPHALWPRDFRLWRQFGIGLVFARARAHHLLQRKRVFQSESFCVGYPSLLGISVLISHHFRVREVASSALQNLVRVLFVLVQWSLVTCLAPPMLGCSQLVVQGTCCDVDGSLEAVSSCITAHLLQLKSAKRSETFSLNGFCWIGQTTAKLMGSFEAD